MKAAGFIEIESVWDLKNLAWFKTIVTEITQPVLAINAPSRLGSSTFPEDCNRMNSKG